MNAHPRLYRIQDKTEVFEAGVLPNQTQIIIGIAAPNLAIVGFTLQGAFEKIDFVPVQPNFSLAAAQTALAEWKHRSQFLPALIAIEKFFLKEHWIGITDLPEHYEEVLQNPNEFDAERRTELLADIDTWLERGDFVFYWSEDYYLNHQGEIISS